MSASNKGKPSPTITKKVAFKSELNINGKIHREVVKNVIYCLCKVSHSYVYSLINRGANGGVAGNDFRVIAAYPDRTVDIRGVDNH